MNRLTYKSKLFYGNKYMFDGNFDRICDKLGKLEDIEEELGIDLITLFKALKDGIYVVEDNDNYIVKDSIKSIENWADGWGISTNMEYLELSFSDYGKTWALDKKELEEND